MHNRSFILTGAIALALVPAAFSEHDGPEHHPTAPEPAQQYTQTNLVSNLSGVAATTDPNLANSWGISRSSGSSWWISDNAAGLSTLYTGTGSITPLVVTIPPGDPKTSSTGTPTGTLFNGTNDFALAPGLPALFLFATEDGTISGWNPGVEATRAVIVVNEGKSSVFKGITMAQASIHGGPLANYVYVTNFRKGKVSVYDSSFHHVPAIESEFSEVRGLRGFAPFNIQDIGGNIYVTYAKQDAEKQDEVDGAGLGYVAVYTPTGHLIQVLEQGPWFNAPWGVAAAPSDFGAYSHDILVGNFGSGEILAFDPVNGNFRGKLRNAKNNTIRIDGLWALSFGSDSASGPATTLFFSSGPDHEANGLFGTLTAIQNTYGNDQ